MEHSGQQIDVQQKISDYQELSILLPLCCKKKIRLYAIMML